eukprot:scaffold155476_cov16-Prasinocladus_malaysianus.AAC.1
MFHRTPASAVRTYYPALVRSWNPYEYEYRSARSEEDSSERTNGLTRHRSRYHTYSYSYSPTGERRDTGLAAAQ